MTRVTSAQEIRTRYVEYFRERGHAVVPSAPLVPRDDPTLLFNSAGMVPFKPLYVLEKPPYSRAVSIQRCLRLSDLDEVGHSPYHDTFFEMLGNFSFGDYFKDQTIEWAWEFLTEVIGLPSDRLWVSVYADDEASAEIWKARIGLPEDRVVRLGDEDNFWGPAGGAGPCGPCSEIYYDMGADRGCGRENCRPGCDCDRFFEVWNLVFPEFTQALDGSREQLARPGVDTGMGLERLCAVVQGVASVFETDLFLPIIEATRSEVEEAGGRRPRSGEFVTELRVIADHVRAATFTIAENVLPSNEAQGYVVRRIIRRAVRRGLAIGLAEPFLYRICGVVVDTMGGAHPHLVEKREHIALVVRSEEERFHETLQQGSAVFDELVAAVEREGSTTVSGADAFRLYDTFGFPLDLTEEMAAERGLAVDVAGFEAAMGEQKDRGRRGSGFSGAVESRRIVWWDRSESQGEPEFVGYDLVSARPARDEIPGETVLSEPVDVRIVGHRDAGEPGNVELLLDKTPFYAEAGGQVADTGSLAAGDGQFDVLNVYRDGNHVLHVVRDADAALAQGERVVAASVDLSRRRRVEKNHSATHLLQAALRVVLGDHVHQSGSWVGPDRLRFDFTHFGELSDGELAAVEDLANAWVRSNLPVEPEHIGLDEALERGAMALFGEKYGDVVRCVTVPGVSIELCGGTHVRRTGEIGAFRISSESGVAAGVRRIEALTGHDAIEKSRSDALLLRETAAALRTTPDELVERADESIRQIGRLRKELKRALRKSAGASIEEMVNGARDVGGVRIVFGRTDAPDIDGLRAQADRLRELLGSGAGVLAAEIDGGGVLVAVATDDLAKSGRLKAGDLVREVAASIGGRGGGRPHMAQGGGDSGRIDEALAAGPEIVARLLDADGGT